METTARASGSKKRVRWSTLTVYEFDVAIGGSAIPRHGGPSVGLAKTPKHVWSASLDSAAWSESDCEDADNQETKQASSPPEHIPDDDEEENGDDSTRQRNVQVRMNKLREHQQRRRRNRVRWLKPLERVTMLTQAGLSEKRICRMMKECAAICMSRRINLRYL